MSELKFRAWSKKHNEWYGESDPDILTFYGFHIFGECTLICTPPTGDLQYLEITQFTGLKDAQCREIYEGDILSDKWRMEVYFANGAFWVRGNSIATELLAGMLHDRKKAGVPLEIIGNIYENPELLND